MADAEPAADALAEKVRRAALGEPGQLEIEVGLEQPRFSVSRGRAEQPEAWALRRALGGVSYPASREQVSGQAGAWLRGQPGLRQRLELLPELTYGSELEVLGALADLEAEEGGTEPPSAAAGNPAGS
ncbi:MAG: hypothetical protein ACREOD_01415 [Candidatus Dormibacteria bacterium]